MAGRKPLPTALKELRGNPGKRSLNRAEPQFERGVMRCPAGLDQRARTEWKRITRVLDAAGILTVADRAMLAVYCQAWSEWIDAEAHLANDGRVLEDKKGRSYPSPYLKVANDAYNRMRQAAIEFGLTPSSRSRLKSEPTNQEPTLAEMLFEATK
jgi:P27 family predicted phage terminase small subunit